MITFGVSTTGNVIALSMCLVSVLNSRNLPHKVQVLFQGEIPSFGNFYLEQLAELARSSGVAFSIHVTKPLGVRGARNWHLENCTTEYLWMGDDDVIYEPECLFGLTAGLDRVPNQIYVQGVKSDLNNRRAYGDFVSQVLPHTELRDFASPNFRYDQLPEGMLARWLRRGTVPTYDVATIDTGNVLFNARKMMQEQFHFQVFKESLNCGGEDTLMALIMRKAGYVGRFSPWAISYHLEKEGGSVFGEMTTRGEMLLRVCEQLDLDTDLLKKGYAPWVFQQAKEHYENQQKARQGGTNQTTERTVDVGENGSTPRLEG